MAGGQFIQCLALKNKDGHLEVTVFVFWLSLSNFYRIVPCIDQFYW
jgi:hypothetical protein